MRLDKYKVNLIKDFWLKEKPDAKIYLFGSRVDDSRRGGDIDILVLSETPASIEQKMNFKSKFNVIFGTQRVDLVNFLFTDTAPFKQIALSESIEL